MQNLFGINMFTSVNLKHVGIGVFFVISFFQNWNLNSWRSTDFFQSIYKEKNIYT